MITVEELLPSEKLENKYKTRASQLLAKRERGKGGVGVWVCVCVDVWVFVWGCVSVSMCCDSYDR